MSVLSGLYEYLHSVGGQFDFSIVVSANSCDISAASK